MFSREREIFFKNVKEKKKCKKYSTRTLFFGRARRSKREREAKEEEEEDSAALFVRSASRGHTARGANNLCVGDIIIIIIIARIF